MSQAIAKRQENAYTRKEVKEEFRTSIVLVMVRWSLYFSKEKLN